MTDLPLHLLSAIALRVAASRLHVAPLPSPGLTHGEEHHTFLGDALTCLPTAVLPLWKQWLVDPSGALLKNYAQNNRIGLPSSHLSPRAWKRMAPLLRTCRSLRQAALQAVLGVDVGEEVASISVVDGLLQLPALRTLLAVGGSVCNTAGCCRYVPNMASEPNDHCTAASAARDRFLVHVVLRRLAINAVGYRGQVLPAALLHSLAAGGATPLRRLALESEDGAAPGLGRCLRFHAGTLEELSLLLPLGARFFQGALAPRHANKASIVLFPALRFLSLLRLHPLDAAKLVAACPALTTARFTRRIPITQPWGQGSPGTHVYPSDCGTGGVYLEDPECHDLSLALAPAVGRGSLTTLEADADCFGGLVESTAGLLASSELLRCLADHAQTLKRVSASVAIQDDAWLHGPGLAPVFPRLCSLSLTMLGDITERADDLLDALCASADRFPALVEMRIALVDTFRTLLSLPRPEASRRAAARDRLRWTVAPRALRRLHLTVPPAVVPQLLSEIESRSLEVLALSADVAEEDDRAFVPTMAATTLTSRCPSLRGLRLERIAADPALPQLLALVGVRTHFRNADKATKPKGRDADRTAATQFFHYASVR